MKGPGHHMRDYKVEAILPDGRTQAITYVSDFNFN
jgi:hypothetical protein